MGSVTRLMGTARGGCMGFTGHTRCCFSALIRSSAYLHIDHSNGYASQPTIGKSLVQIPPLTLLHHIIRRHREGRLRGKSQQVRNMVDRQRQLRMRHEQRPYDATALACSSSFPVLSRAASGLSLTNCCDWPRNWYNSTVDH